MCTAFKYKGYMGRNFDYERSYNEQLVQIPANAYDNEYAMIGVCAGDIVDHTLLYDGMNEHGLAMAGLAFEGNAEYFQDGIPAYDLIFQVLGHCRTVVEVKAWVDGISNEQFADIPNADLHWFVCDTDNAIVIESTSDGLHIYNSEVGVLTNNPPYPQQIEAMSYSYDNIGNYPDAPTIYKSRGEETWGLLGDYTSISRFSRVVYIKSELETNSDFDSPAQAFHLLSSVEQVYGMTPVGDDYEYTIYSIVYDMNNKDLVVKTYDDINTYHLDMLGMYEIHEEVRLGI